LFVVATFKLLKLARRISESMAPKSKIQNGYKLLVNFQTGQHSVWVPDCLDAMLAGSMSGERILGQEVILDNSDGNRILARLFLSWG